MSIKYMGGNYAVSSSKLEPFGGSSLLAVTRCNRNSSYFTVGPKFYPKKRTNGERYKLDTLTGQYNLQVSLSECLPHSVIFTKDQEKKPPIKRKYTFNKKAIFTRAMTFADLDQSREFLAFYSISFPEKTPDVICRRALHTLLVRLKESFGLRGYIIVCERQKNGTLHFHMLVNDYMPVRYSSKDDPQYLRPSVNSFLQVTLFNLGVYHTLDEARKYNGVDVERVNTRQHRRSRQDSKKRVVRYLIKYIAKGEENEWDFRPWRCSHSVSCLFTCAYLDLQLAQLDDLQVEYNMWAVIYRWKKETRQKDCELAYKNMCRLNSLVYDLIGQLEKVQKLAEFVLDNQKDRKLFFRFDKDGNLYFLDNTLQFSTTEYICEDIFDSTSILDYDPDFDEQEFIEHGYNSYDEWLCDIIDCPF